jgi:hypothetical protein
MDALASAATPSAIAAILEICMAANSTVRMARVRVKHDFLLYPMSLDEQLVYT